MMIPLCFSTLPALFLFEPKEQKSWRWLDGGGHACQFHELALRTSQSFMGNTCSARCGVQSSLIQQPELCAHTQLLRKSRNSGYQPFRRGSSRGLDSDPTLTKSCVGFSLFQKGLQAPNLQLLFGCYTESGRGLMVKAWGVHEDNVRRGRSGTD